MDKFKNKKSTSIHNVIIDIYLFVEGQQSEIHMQEIKGWGREWWHNHKAGLLSIFRDWDQYICSKYKEWLSYGTRGWLNIDFQFTAYILGLYTVLVST